MANDYNKNDDSFLEAHIIAYANGQLEGQALKDFEERMATDTSVAEEVLLRKQLKFIQQNKQAVQAAQNMRDFLNNNPLPPKTSLKAKIYASLSATWFIALGVTAIVGIMVYVNISPPPVSGLVKNNFKHYDTHTSSQIANLILQKGMDNYNHQKYQLAIEDLTKFPNDNEIQLYLGVSYIGTEKYTEAIRILEKSASNLGTHEDYLKNPILWYLSLAYVGANQKEKALEVLGKIKEGAVYDKQAEGLKIQLK